MNTKQEKIKNEHPPAFLLKKLGLATSDSDAVLVADDDGRYVYANEAACGLLGVPLDKLLGSQITDYLPADFNFEKAWSRFLWDGTQDGEIVLVRPDGTRTKAAFRARRDISPGRHLSVLREERRKRRR